MSATQFSGRIGVQLDTSYLPEQLSLNVIFQQSVIIKVLQMESQSSLSVQCYDDSVVKQTVKQQDLNNLSINTVLISFVGSFLFGYSYSK